MKTIRTLAAITAALLGAADVAARSWVDSQGRIVEGNVTGLTAARVVLRLQGGRLLEVQRAKLSASDQQHLIRFELHRRTANRFRIDVGQATGTGAFGKLFRVRTVAVQRDVPTHYSSLDQRWEYERRTVNEDVVDVLYDKVYVEGLTRVAEGEVVDIIAWTAGTKDYETVSGAAASVPKFKLDPPEGEVAIEAGDFGK